MDRRGFHLHLQHHRWGLGYFSINDAGNVSISPLREKGVSIDMLDVLDEAVRRGLQFPLVLRFQDLLRDRVEWLNKSFREAIAENKYGGSYFGVFPIKVNQLREVVEEIAMAGEPFDYGLEAGSKPELFSALATHRNPNSLIICNGYKDTAFIRTAMIGRRLGKKIILIAEKLEEVDPLSKSAAKPASIRGSAYVCVSRQRAPVTGRHQVANLQSSVYRRST